MTPLTREEAEKRGWGFWSGAAHGMHIACGGNGGQHPSLVGHRPHDDLDSGILELLPTITAIERYEEAEKLLEECAVLLIAYRNQCRNADDLKSLGDSLLAKLEARQ